MHLYVENIIFSISCSISYNTMDNRHYLSVWKSENKCEIPMVKGLTLLCTINCRMLY